MGDAKVELGDGVTSSHGSELMVRQEDLEGAMNSMKQHAPIWNGVKADYPAWLWEAVPFLDSMGLKKYRPPVLNEEQHTNMLKHGTQDEITKAESMLEKLFRAFLRMISRSKDHPEAITLRMMIQAEFAEERDGFLLMLYVEGYANDQSVAEVKVLKRDIQEMVFRANETPAQWELKMQQLYVLWKRIPEAKRGGTVADLSDMLLDKMPTSCHSYVMYVRAFASVLYECRLCRR